MYSNINKKRRNKIKKEKKGFLILLVIISVSCTYISTLIHHNEYHRNINYTKSIEQIPNLGYTVNKTPFVVGFRRNPRALDPVDSWDITEKNIQQQVVEGLVDYNYSSHPNYEIIPVLAEGWHWHNNKEIEFKIRENVYFHDGNLLDAEVIKWNFERIMYFCNSTGSLPKNATSWKALPSELFYLTNGSFIFNNFSIDNPIDIGGGIYKPYNLTIHLNHPFGPLLDLLCFGANKILSPSSTPRYRYLDLNSEILVGTGPFKYDEFEYDNYIKFHAYHNYWRGKAEIEEMIWKIIDDDSARMDAALAGEFDYIDGVTQGYIDTFRADPDWHVEDVGEAMIYYYLEIYCGPFDTYGNWYPGYDGDYQYQRNPPYLRRALALALNYSYMYEEIREGYAVEGTTAVPRLMPGHNSSVVQASDSKFTFLDNLVKARQLLQANAVDIEARGGMSAVMISTLDPYNENDWQGKNILGRNLEVNLIIDWMNNMRINELMQDNFNKIGIQINVIARYWDEYKTVGLETPYKMDIAYKGWGADYLNPYDLIDHLFRLNSIYSYSQINDISPGGLTELMDLAVSETDYGVQLDLYKDIQSLIFDVERSLNNASHVHISLWVNLVQSVYRPYFINNFHPNVMSVLDFYPCEWNIKIPGDFELSSDAGYPDMDGNFTLLWDESVLADNYTIYQYHRPIYEINGSLTDIATEITGYSLPVSISDNGYKYFVAVANNEDGTTMSNCIEVLILVPSFILTTDADYPDTDGSFNLIWTGPSGAENYSIFTSDSEIKEDNFYYTILAYQNATSPYSITALSNGTYYYMVVAHLGFDVEISTCIGVTVSLSEEPPVTTPPGSFILSTSADTPDTDGHFVLIWTKSTGADNYSIYKSDSYITQITPGLTLVTELAISPHSTSEFENGDYYYIVVAYNIIGSRLSTCIKIVVELDEDGNGDDGSYEIIHGYDGFLFIAVIGVVSGILTFRQFKKRNLKS